MIATLPFTARTLVGARVLFRFRPIQGPGPRPTVGPTPVRVEAAVRDRIDAPDAANGRRLALRDMDRVGPGVRVLVPAFVDTAGPVFKHAYYTEIFMRNYALLSSRYSLASLGAALGNERFCRLRDGRCLLPIVFVGGGGLPPLAGMEIVYASVRFPIDMATAPGPHVGAIAGAMGTSHTAPARYTLVPVRPGADALAPTVESRIVTCAGQRTLAMQAGKILFPPFTAPIDDPRDGVRARAFLDCAWLAYHGEAVRGIPSTALWDRAFVARLTAMRGVGLTPDQKARAVARAAYATIAASGIAPPAGVRVGATFAVNPLTNAVENVPATDAMGNPLPPPAPAPPAPPAPAGTGTNPDLLDTVQGRVAHAATHGAYGALTGGVAGAAVGLVLGHGPIAGGLLGALIGGVGNAALGLVGLD